METTKLARIIIAAAFIAFALAVKPPDCLAQNPTVKNMVDFSTQINKLYNENPAIIDNIVTQYIPKGYLLMDFTETKGPGSLDNTTHTLQNFNLPTTQISFSTSLYGGSGYTKLITITFSTQDLPTFQQWLNDISTNANFMLKGNYHNAIAYKYVPSNASVMLGMVAVSNVTNGAALIQDIKVTSPVNFTLTFSYSL